MAIPTDPTLMAELIERAKRHFVKPLVIGGREYFVVWTRGPDRIADYVPYPRSRGRSIRRAKLGHQQHYAFRPRRAVPE